MLMSSGWTLFVRSNSCGVSLCLQDKESNRGTVIKDGVAQKIRGGAQDEDERERDKENRGELEM